MEYNKRSGRKLVNFTSLEMARCFKMEYKKGGKVRAFCSDSGLIQLLLAADFSYLSLYKRIHKNLANSISIKARHLAFVIRHDKSFSGLPFCPIKQLC